MIEHATLTETRTAAHAALERYQASPAYLDDLRRDIAQMERRARWDPTFALKVRRAKLALVEALDRQRARR